jgi:hypothetical protein
MRAQVCIRRIGESTFRDLGRWEMSTLPALGSMMTMHINGESVTGKVHRTDVFPTHEHGPAPDPRIELIETL